MMAHMTTHHHQLLNVVAVVGSLLLLISLAASATVDSSSSVGFISRPAAAAASSRRYEYHYINNNQNHKHSLLNKRSEAEAELSSASSSSPIQSLDYSVEFKDSVHSLDAADTPILSISCPPSSSSSSSFEVIVKDKKAVEAWGQDFILTANECGSTEEPFMKHVTAVEWISATTARLTAASNALYTDLFQHADIDVSFSSTPSTVAVQQQQQLRKKRASTVTSPVVLQPAAGQSYVSGDSVAVTWDAPASLREDNYFVVELHYKSLTTNADLSIGSAKTVSSTVRTETLPITAAMPGANSYYVLLQWCSQYWECYNYTSGIFSVNYSPADILIIAPTRGSLMSVSTTTTVAWASVSSLAGSVVKLSLHLFSGDTAEPDSLIAGPFESLINDGSYSYTLPASMVASDKYYWQLQYVCNGGVNCIRSTSSPLFSIAGTDTTYLTITSPKRTTSITSKTSIPVTWVSNGFATGDTVTLGLYRQTFVGRDRLLGSVVSVPVANGQATIDISALSLSFSTNYYIWAEYSCVDDYCSHSKSHKFALNTPTTLPVSITQPISDSVHPVGQTVTLTYGVPTALGAGHISVRQDWPALMDSDLDPLWQQSSAEASVNLIAGAGKTWSFTPSVGAPYYAYFMVSYNCLVGKYGCNRISSPTFQIPANPSATAATPASYSLYRQDCSSTNPAFSTTTVPSNLCTVGKVPTAYSVTCSSCSASVVSATSRLRFTVVNGEWTSFSLSVGGNATISLASLAASLPADYSIDSTGPFGGPMALFGVAPGTTFSLGPISFKLSMYLTVNWHLTASVSTAAELSVGYSRLIPFTALIQKTSSTSSSATMTASSTGSGATTTTMITNGNVQLKVVLETQLTATIADVLTAKTTVTPTITATARSQYPAYPATTTCSSPHVVEYSLDYTYPYSATATFLGDATTAQTGTTTPASSLLTSGCLETMATVSAITAETYTANAVLSTYLATSYSSLTSTSLTLALAKAIARTLNINQATLLVTATTTSSTVVVQFLNATNVQLSKIALFKQIYDPDSTLYTTPVFSALRGRFTPPSCPTGNYTNLHGVCVPCSMGLGGVNCVTCDSHTAVCSKCSTGNFLDSSKVCTPCPTNTYSANGLTCSTCTGCGTCNPSTGVCTGCPAGYFFNTAGSRCVACSAKFWAPANTVGSCKTCSNTGGFLQACNSTTGAATLCPAGRPIDGTDCGSPCTTGTYTLGSTACLPCPSPCTACAYNTGLCTRCPVGYGLVAGVCTVCSSGTYSFGNTSCLACPASTSCTCDRNTGLCPDCSSYDGQRANCLANNDCKWCASSQKCLSLTTTISTNFSSLSAFAILNATADIAWSLLSSDPVSSTRTVAILNTNQVYLPNHYSVLYWRNKILLGSTISFVMYHDAQSSYNDYVALSYTAATPTTATNWVDMNTTTNSGRWQRFNAAYTGTWATHTFSVPTTLRNKWYYVGFKGVSQGNGVNTPGNYILLDTASIASFNSEEITHTFNDMTGYVNQPVTPTTGSTTPVWSATTFSSTKCLMFNSEATAAGNSAVVYGVIPFRVTGPLSMSMYHDTASPTSNDTVVPVISTTAAAGSWIPVGTAVRRYASTTADWSSYAFDMSAYLGGEYYIGLKAISRGIGPMYVKSLTVSNLCSTCDSAANLASKTSCLATQWEDPTTTLAYPCARCSSSTCTFQKPTSCTCTAGKEWSSATDSCADCTSGFYSITGTTGCLSCAELTTGCSVCTTTTGVCTGCSAGYGYASNACTKCSDGQSWSAGSTASCTRCSAACRTCNPETGACTSCSAGYYWTTSNTCSACSGNTWSNGTSCQTCPSYCSTCESTTGACTSCPAGQGYYNSSHSCMTCGVMTWSNGVTGCLYCNASCASCSSATGLCTSCPAGYGLVSGRCLPCSSTGLTWSAGGTAACSLCEKDYCSLCSTTSGLCTKCIAGYHVTSSGTCAECDGNTYSTTGLTCSACPSQCSTCSSTTGACLTCPFGSGLVWNNCFVCKDGLTSAGGITGCSQCSVFNDDRASCLAASSQCSWCASSKKCQPLNNQLALPFFFSGWGVASSSSAGWFMTDAGYTSVIAFNSATTASGSTAMLVSAEKLAVAGDITFWMFHDSTASTSSDSVQLAFSYDNSAWTYVGSPILRYSSTQSGWVQHVYHASETTGLVYIGFLGTSQHGADILLDDFAITTTAPTCSSCSATNVAFCNLTLWEDTAGTSYPCVACTGSPSTCSALTSSSGCPCDAGQSKGTDGVCTVCDTGYFSDGTAPCTKCDKSCLTCDQATGHCLSCSSGYGYNSVTGSCSLCAPNQWSDGTVACQSCSSDCHVCEGSTGLCEICKYQFALNSGVCSACKAGFYSNGTVPECITCPTRCGTTCNFTSSCLCTPKTCTQLGKTCGTWADGCTGTVTCSPGCTSSDQTCYKGNCCKPKTCASEDYSCGTWDDGCGGTFTCGSCTSGKTCTAGGYCCTPMTCESMHRQCFTVDDGCSNTLDCSNAICTSCDTGTGNCLTCANGYGLSNTYCMNCTLDADGVNCLVPVTSGGGSGIGTGAIIGIAVGGSVGGVALLIGLSLLAFLGIRGIHRYRIKHKKASIYKQDVSMSEMYKEPAANYDPSS